MGRSIQCKSLVRKGKLKTVYLQVELSAAAQANTDTILVQLYNDGLLTGKCVRVIIYAAEKSRVFYLMLLF